MRKRRKDIDIAEGILPKVKIPFKIRAYRLIRKVLIGFILASLVNFVFSYFFHTPKVYSLGKENSELLIKYRVLQERIDASVEQLKEIKKRDNGIYRSIFAVDTLVYDLSPDAYIAANSNIYKSNRYYPVMQQAWLDLENMQRLLFYESVSLDTLQVLAKDKEKMAEAIPAIWPLDKNKVRGHIGSYGYRIHPIHHTRMKHDGMDFAAPIGTPVYTTAEGTVTHNGYDRGYGRSIIIDHGYGYKTRYAHLNKALVTVGQKVKRGEQVGEVGNTGQSTGPHLHYEVIYRGATVNPINYFSKDMSDEDFQRIIKAARNITYEKEQ